MRIIHKKTGAILDVTSAEWEKMNRMGNRESWRIFDQSSTVVTQGREITITLEDIKKVVEPQPEKKVESTNKKHGNQRKKRPVVSADEGAQ